MKRTFFLIVVSIAGSSFLLFAVILVGAQTSPDIPLSDKEIVALSKPSVVRIFHQVEGEVVLSPYKIGYLYPLGASTFTL